MTSIRVDARPAWAGPRRRAASNNTIVDRSAAATRANGQAVNTRMHRVAARADGAIQQARSNAQALLREVTGQGPEITLARGFAIVRTDDAKPVTSSVQVRVSPTLSIQFGASSMDVRPSRSTPRKEMTMSERSFRDAATHIR